MSAVALRCDADAERKLAHLRERFAEAFPVRAADEGVGRDVDRDADDGAGGDVDAVAPFAPVAAHGTFVLASGAGPVGGGGQPRGLPGRPRHFLGHRRARLGACGRKRKASGAGVHGGLRHRCDRPERCGLAEAPRRGDPVLRRPSARHAGRLRRGGRPVARLRSGHLGSEVPAGCGLSSSAAFEVMVGAVLEALFGPGPFAGTRNRHRPGRRGRGRRRLRSP